MADRLLMCSDCADGGENFFCKGDHQTAEQAQEALGTLAGVMRLDAHAYLYDAPAEDDDADGLDDIENKIRQAADNGQRIIGGQGRDRAEGQGPIRLRLRQNSAV